jgi:hypothetical protein
MRARSCGMLPSAWRQWQEFEDHFRMQEFGQVLDDLFGIGGLGAEFMVGWRFFSSRSW